MKKIYELHTERDILAGVLFSKEFDKVGSPFGGTYDDYQKRFASYFIVNTMENNDLSIPGRKN
ncbi:MAG TPA: hypothetical protein PKC30_12405 [Saprospiraceae bacterium]|nr:hypothetical protein [Saprospiraceae bacterium]